MRERERERERDEDFVSEEEKAEARDPNVGEGTPEEAPERDADEYVEE